MAKTKKQKAVRKIEKAVRKAVDKGVAETAVEKAVHKAIGERTADRATATKRNETKIVTPKKSKRSSKPADAE